MKRDVFQGIADPTRREILLLVAEQACSAGEIAAHFDISQQAVSKHLRLLAQCALLSRKQVGREVYYQLDAEKIKEVDHWLVPFKRVWNKRFSQLDQVLDKLKTKKS